MTEAMPFLRKIILLSYDPRPFWLGLFLLHFLFSFKNNEKGTILRSIRNFAKSPFSEI